MQPFNYICFIVSMPQTWCIWMRPSVDTASQHQRSLFDPELGCWHSPFGCLCGLLRLLRFSPNIPKMCGLVGNLAIECCPLCVGEL